MDRKRGVRRGEKEWAKIIRRFESSGLAGHGLLRKRRLSVEQPSALAAAACVARFGSVRRACPADGVDAGLCVGLVARAHAAETALRSGCMAR